MLKSLTLTSEATGGEVKEYQFKDLPLGCSFELEGKSLSKRSTRTAEDLNEPYSDTVWVKANAVVTADSKHVEYCINEAKELRGEL